MTDVLGRVPGVSQKCRWWGRVSGVCASSKEDRVLMMMLVRVLMVRGGGGLRFVIYGGWWHVASSRVITAWIKVRSTAERGASQRTHTWRLPLCSFEGPPALVPYLLCRGGVLRARQPKGGAFRPLLVRPWSWSYKSFSTSSACPTERLRRSTVESSFLSRRYTSYVRTTRGLFACP